jgi:mono/diheme cytochrome c family protein
MLLLTTAVTAQAPPTIWSGVFSESQAFRGEKVADTLCIGCHGAGFRGGDSGPKLTGGTFLEDWTERSLGDLYEWMLKSMPEDAPGTLTPRDAAAVLAYILQVNEVPAGKQDLPADRDALARVRIAPRTP